MDYVIHGDGLNCTEVNEHTVSCDGKDYTDASAKYAPGETWFFIYLGIYVALVILAGTLRAVR